MFKTGYVRRYIFHRILGVALIFAFCKMSDWKILIDRKMMKKWEERLKRGMRFTHATRIHSNLTNHPSPITHHQSPSPIALTSISREERRFLGHRRCRHHRGRTLSHFAGDDALDSPRCDFPRPREDDPERWRRRLRLF